ncbi:MAG TPA: Nif3-like dinuclear metal center hexameric protein [Thermoleophilaceae bacterium]|nr:Nif3-like dinuclear metal center hexameric protein [Thermoleophilaceae bacterium]
MATRDALIAYLQELLDPDSFDDYGPNGLQVPGASEVSLVATGVSAHRELFETAAQAGADLVLCHHGILWDSEPRPITPALKARLEALFGSDMSLAAYHLPLDAHPEVGNNALICHALGLERSESFGAHKGRDIGWVGRSSEGIPFADLVERCRGVFGQEPFAWDSGPEVVESVGILSGGGASSFAEAIALGLDAFITGEPAEPAMADAREAGVHFIAAGHYATETFGVRRLGELLHERFGVEHRFVEIRNPI